MKAFHSCVHIIAAIILSALFIGGGNACYGQSKNINDVVKEFQSELPLSLGTMGEITSFSISDGNLFMECRVNEEVVDIPSLKKNPSLMKESMKQWMLTPNSGYSFMLDALEEAGLGLKVLYIGKESGERVSCELTSTEIKGRSAHLSDYDPQKLLNLQIELASAQLTQKDLEDSDEIVCTKIYRKGKYVIYEYIADETTIEALKMIKPAVLKSLTLDELNSDDVTLSQFRRICKNAGVGIAYYYIGKKSGKKIKLLFPAKELK